MVQGQIAEPELRKNLFALLWERDPDLFVSEARRLHLQSSDSIQLAHSIALELAPTLYWEEYPGYLNHGMLGIMAAAQAENFIFPYRKNLAIIQSLWNASLEEKSAPYVFSQTSNGTGKVKLKEFRGALETMDDELLHYALARSVGAEDYTVFRDELLSWAMRDVYDIGHKLIYLVKTIEFIELTQSNEAARLLFPAVHYLRKAPEDREYALILEEKLAQLELPREEYLSNKDDLSREEADRLERVIVFHYPALIIENLVYELNDGISIGSLFEVILRAASQAILSAHPKHWVYAIHGYNFAHAARQAFQRTQRIEDRLFLPFIAALMVNKMAASSLNPHKGESLFLHVDEDVSPGGLRDAIEASEPVRAGRIAYQLGEEGKALSAIAQTLVNVAAQNDGSMAFGHDLKLAVHSVTDYQASRVAGRAKYLAGCAYFLAQIEKDYDLFRELYT